MNLGSIYLNNLKYLLFLLRKYVKVTSLLVGFFIFGLILAPVTSGDFKTQILADSIEHLSQIGQDGNLFLGILSNNLKSSFLSLVLGITLIFPIFVTFINSFLISAVIELVVRIFGIRDSYQPELYLAAVLLPHGIVEIPISVISDILGLLIGLKILFNKIETHESRLVFIKKVILAYAVVIVPLFILAAFIESYISVNISRPFAPTVSQDIAPASQKLESIILQTSDFQNLGVKAERQTINMKSLSGNNPFVIRELITMIYDDELFQEIKKLKTEFFAQRSYKLSDSSNLLIRIYQFNSGADAESYLKIPPQTFKILTRDKNIKIRDLMNGIYFVENNNKKTYIYYKTYQNYFYLIEYSGSDQGLFKRIINLQAAKLIQ